MWDHALRWIDGFIPEQTKQEQSDHGRARNFVFTHFAGPALGQSIGAFLYFADPSPGLAFWVVEVCICSFWLMPIALKVTRNLQAVAYASVQLLTFVTLFGCYFYGGMSSPFLPWLLVALLLGFFYLSERPLLIVGSLTAQLLGFFAAYAAHGGFPELVSPTALSGVGLISVFSATVYMSWMAIYYAEMMSQQSAIEREAEAHRVTEMRLREAMAEAENANKAKSIFVAKMSHELRTPLNAVIGYSELLLEECDDDLEQKYSDLKRINSAGRHLLALVTDVLDISRIESFTTDLNVETFNLDTFVDDLIDTALPLMSKNDNRLDVTRLPDLGEVTTDQTKLRQCLLNLLSNAAKFTRDGVITLTVLRDQDTLNFEVQDTGIGIPEETIAQLFQDFKQATAATSKNYGGTGLGLALVDRFTMLMGGEITVTSVVDKGSRFAIRVPAHIEAMNADEPRLIAA